MKGFIKNHWKTILLFTLAGLVGGYFSGFYALKGYSEEMQQEMLAQGMTPVLLSVVTAIQSAGYGLFLGTLGILLSEKIGLWNNKVEWKKKPVILTIATSVIGGLLLIFPDLLFFGKYSQEIADSFLTKPTFGDIIAMVLYGGVIEEIMTRLFLMSLFTFVLHLLFERKKEQISTWIFVIANIVSALLFAAGHLPTAAATIGITPIILLRCFLINGGIGIVFGRVYRKYGIAYAMLAHAGCHIISKLIWVLFL